MDDSILRRVKHACMLDPIEATQFDSDLVMYVNSVFMTLHQLGIGPKEGFKIEGSDETWSDFIGPRLDLGSVETYVCLKVRLLFDPPANSFLLDAINEQLKELEWRLIAQVERSD